MNGLKIVDGSGVIKCINVKIFYVENGRRHCPLAQNKMFICIMEPLLRSNFPINSSNKLSKYELLSDLMMTKNKLFQVNNSVSAVTL